MFKNVKKRNGKLVEFDASKITAAIAKAGRATGEFGEKEAEELTKQVLELAVAMREEPSLEDDRKTKAIRKFWLNHGMRLGQIPSVEEIQDIVERILIDSPFSKTAKAYIIYREQHAQIRQIATRANVDLVDNYIRKLDWKIKENSNMSYSLQGLNNYISSDITSEYWLNKIYPPEIRRAHKNGDLHIHDLSLLSVYCVGWDLMDLLKNGFKGVKGKVESAPPKHFRAALGQIINFFYTLQGEAAGAQAVSNFDTLLAPFVRFDGLEYREVKQCLQEFVFNINIPTRVGFQTPFTNITIDLNVPSVFKDTPVIIGGKERRETYSDFQHEMDLINKAFAEVMIEGDAMGRVFTFPIPTYNITVDFDWDNPDLEVIWKMTGRYGIPYFSNFVNSDLSPDDTRSMCCRLRLDKRELLKRGGGLFGANPLTGSIGVVTINLPRIGHFAKTEEEFLSALEEKVNIAAESLAIKRKVLENFTEKDLYPYTKFYLRKVKSHRGEYWKNHFSTIGIVGMNEACLNLIGENITTPRGLEFSLKTMDFLREKISKIQEEKEEIFNLEATPAEGTSYRLSKIDKNCYPNIICANENGYQDGAAPYYTNSTQLPVEFSDDLFETLTLQDGLQVKYTGGTALHIYLGEQIKDSEALKQLVKKVATNFKLPYFTITPTFSICPNDGYLSGRQEKCSKCGEETEVYSRVVGYLRPVKQWNLGKRAEFSMRKTFKVA